MLPNILLEDLLEALYLYHAQGDDYMEGKIWEEIKFLVGIL